MLSCHWVQLLLHVKPVNSCHVLSNTYFVQFSRNWRQGKRMVAVKWTFPLIKKNSQQVFNKI